MWHHIHIQYLVRLQKSALGGSNSPSQMTNYIKWMDSLYFLFHNNVQKLGVNKFLKEVSYAQQGCIYYLIRNTVKTEKLSY